MAASCVIIWRSARGFETASDYLGRNLSKGVKGATINAIASSMPEFLSTLFFLFYLGDINGFSGGLGITAGSAIFNLLIIPALVIIVVLIRHPRKTISVSRSVLARDGLVYLAVVFILLMILSPDLRPIHGFLLLIAYIVYLLFLLLSIKDMKNKPLNNNSKDRIIRRKNWWGRLLLLDLEAMIINERPIRTLSAWVLLLVSTIIMSLGTWLLVYGTERLSNSLNIPILFIAVVLSAVASSVPDTVISVKDARKGNYDDAISNALGSNIFDISFALGFPLLLYTLAYHPIKMDESVVELSSELWMFLLVTTVLGIIILVAGKKLTLAKAILFLLIYLIFLLYVLGQAMGSEIIHRVMDELHSAIGWIKNIF
jgi:Ca2+/Na+ antiporter